MKAQTQRFGVGDRVRVRTGQMPGHVRTPFYLRGKRGMIADVVGDFRSPEQLAYHKPGLPLCALYHVRFEQGQLWADYAGNANDVLEADIFDHWLDRDTED